MCVIVTMPDGRAIQGLAQLRATFTVPDHLVDTGLDPSEDVCLCVVDVPGVLELAGVPFEPDDWGIQVLPTDMPVLSLWQPWATLIALGAKTIETRGWATSYRGPLAIAATASIPSALGLPRRGRATLGDYEVERDAAGLLLRGPMSWPYRLPLGSIVATCTLHDVLPMDVAAGERECIVVGDGDLTHWIPGEGWAPGQPGPALIRDVTDQGPYGDFRPGRFAWMVADVVPLHEPVPFKGGQRLTRRWDPKADTRVTKETA